MCDLLYLAFLIVPESRQKMLFFSALRRPKTYKNKSITGQLSSLAITSIEAVRLLKIKANKGDFYNRVLEIFVEKDRCMGFIYKERWAHTQLKILFYFSCYCTGEQNGMV